jgi:hypothetical protein
MNFQMIQVKSRVCILQLIYKKNMLVELCGSNYATFDGLVNGVNGIFKTSTTHFKITIIWIMF